MSTWREFAQNAPELASRVEALFTSRKHHTIATIRRDGSPRIGGTEIQISDGQLRFGMMSGARRGWDLRRDPRMALHSQSIDPPEDNPGAWPGEAKVRGRATELSRGEVPGGDYQIDITDVVLTYLDGELRIDHWTLARGVVQHTR